MALPQDVKTATRAHYHNDDPEYPRQCERWGYSFPWNSNHMTAEELHVLRNSHDIIGLAAYESLKSILDAERTPSNDKTLSITGQQSDDWYDVLRIHHHEDDALQGFWNGVHTVPDWVDWKQIERGQRLFAKYASANLTFLFFYGFLRGSGVSGVKEVFTRTTSFTIQKFLPQFMGNFAWLIKVTNSLEYIQPGGEGHIDTIRIRLIHASVLHRIMKLAKIRPGYFNVEKIGLPINYFNSLHVLSIVSGSVLWDGLPKLGITASKQEQEDYIALFRYLAYLNGVPSERFENCEMAKATMESFLLAEEQPTPALKILAEDFVRWIEFKPPLFLSRGFLMAGFHHFNGAEYCQALGFTSPSFHNRMSFKGLCLLLNLVSLAQLWIPSFDQYIVIVSKFLYHITRNEHAKHLMTDFPQHLR
ncbi:uncharacterized protein LY89DRAFT_704824 [Mollisia scopiformis]|uniref:ER-bound oxygenase mpaB/mpaB'/Rubber oxygenase catalytic domain-containing protein n=1 Tax=Mollisia scopiformis TaxID=149040 RepID=A0A194XPS6_MOLSC|nr:uncharacterized protein LY89DRAFT_704824 [Mollisia scopiformis]KUJ22166.1 hypothetical protein LY89DRAFT_704824 [Mollisia scopiformis]